jgi:hypothetical protein
MTSWGKAGAYMGLAFITPISGYACYVLGQYVDQQYHSKWAAVAGIIIGCAAGMYETVRQAIRIEGLDKRK